MMMIMCIDLGDLAKSFSLLLYLFFVSDVVKFGLSLKNVFLLLMMMHCVLQTSICTGRTRQRDNG